MKKLIIVFVALVTAIGLAGCGGDNGPPPDHIDLTAMSEIEGHAILVDMFLTRSQDYVGVTIKAQGEFDIWEEDETGVILAHFLWVGGEGCCPTFLDFYYPNVDTLEIGMTILLEGVFSAPTETVNHFHVHVTSLTIV